MYTQRAVGTAFCLALAALMVLVDPTASAPHTTEHTPTMDLAAVVNRTVCPIEVQYDRNPERTPRVIKMLKCAPSPNHYCRQQSIPDNECCRHDHNQHVMRCVEILDSVLVKFTNTSAPVSIMVPVGCTCLISRSHQSSDVPTR